MIPFPITELTMEQKFQLIKLLQQAKNLDREDILAVLESALHHNLLLRSTVNNLVTKWPYEAESDLERNRSYKELAPPQDGV